MVWSKSAKADVALATLSLDLVCVGRTKAGAERDLATRYLDRARLAGKALGFGVGLREIPESKARRPADRKAEEAAAIRTAVAGAMLVVLDERGRTMDSESFAGLLRKALDGGEPCLAFVIGGPDGLDPALREAAREAVALGAMTWPHQLARIMLAEQVYRAITIIAGHPYHRA